MLETTVVVIGGGATGMGTLRDLCMRGVPAILLEQGGLAHGTSSRFHGLLHSGGRYAVNDNESARECIEENMIVRRIGRQCVEETEGFFALTPGDDPAYVAPWAEACHKAGIDAQELDVAEALRLEPNLAPDIRRVFRVPDSCVDGFRLVLHNAMSAKRYGGRVLTYHEVTAIHQNNGTVCGVTALDRISGEMVEISCQSVVNAAGSWSGRIAGLAGLDVAVSPDRGTLIVFNHRFTSRVVNRLHPGADGDIFVPHGSITILGTTSTPTDRPDDTTPTYGEVLRLLDLGEPLFPAVRQYRILRAFAGTRPLYTPGNAAGRKASRNFHVVDHAEQGLKGMVSIFGGKLTVSYVSLLTIAACVVIMIGLTTFVNKSKMGKAMRACSEDKAAAQLMGINVNATISATFAIGSALAAIAGVLLCSFNTSLMPTTGSMPGIKAFTAAVFGGIGSIPGAFLGGLLLGIIEAMAQAYISTNLANSIVFAVLIVVLLVKPAGLLGKSVTEKV